MSSDNNDLYELIDIIKRSLDESHTTQDVLINDISPSLGRELFDYFDEKITSRKTHDTHLSTFRIKQMQTFLQQDCVQSYISDARWKWHLDQFTTTEEHASLKCWSGTSINFETGLYSGSSKDPDVFFTAGCNRKPSIAVETGWSESLIVWLKLRCL